MEFRPDLKDKEEYIALVRDYGWSFLQGPNSWLYFWKETEENPSDNEIFSDDRSRMGMVRKTALQRFIPVLIISVLMLALYLFFVIPDGNIAEMVVTGMMVALIVAMDIHLFIGYYRIQKQYLP
ncbi:MAG: DUF2812 domain-containing protein [Bilifractor sp.]